MEHEFNDFSKDVERRKNEIKGWARIKLELSELKTNKDFAQAVNKEIIKLEQEDENKSERIKNLENEFIDSSNRLQNIADEVSKGYLRKEPYTNLKNMLDNLVTVGEDLYILSQEYAELIGNEVFTHPNYDKYLDYSSVVFDALELEIALRER